MVSSSVISEKSFNSINFFRYSETELSALRSRNGELEVLAMEEKSKTETIDELNKEIAEKNKVTETTLNYYFLVNFFVFSQ